MNNKKTKIKIYIILSLMFMIPFLFVCTKESLSDIINQIGDKYDELNAKLSAPNVKYPIDGTSITSRKSLFQWTQSAEGATYSMDISKSNTFDNITLSIENITDTQYIPNDCLVSDTYFWRIKAYKDADKSYWSSTNSFILQTEAPTMVSPADAFSTNELKPTLDWSSTCENNMTYSLLVSTALDFSAVVQNTVLNTSNFTFGTNLNTNTTYYWKVNAKDNGVSTSSYSSYRSLYIDNYPPAEITNLYAMRGDTKVTLSWNEPTAIDFSYVEITYPSGTPTNTVTVNKGSLSVNVNSLTNGNTYSFNVKSVDALGNKSAGQNISSTPGADPYYEEMVQINSALDSYTMGDGHNTGLHGCDCRQTLTYNFKMSKYEVTNAWFKQALDDGLYTNSVYWTSNGWSDKALNHWIVPSQWVNNAFNRSDQPVIGVSWYEAVAFCNWLSVRKGLTPVYNINGGITSLTANGYRLPTEVEWEYSASKGASGMAEHIFSWAPSTSTADFDCSKLVNGLTCPTCTPVCTPATNPANVGSKPVGSTPQGLYDMSGNVWEWCSDTYEGTPATSINRYYFASDYLTNSMMCRGGGWKDTNVYSFCLRHDYHQSPNARNQEWIGFRVILP